MFLRKCGNFYGLKHNFNLVICVAARGQIKLEVCILIRYCKSDCIDPKKGTDLSLVLYAEVSGPILDFKPLLMNVGFQSRHLLGYLYKLQ